jgi:predicted transcriptional regulator
LTKTAAQKRATNKWNKANMTSLAVSLRKEEAERIKSVCYANNTNPSAIMRAALDEFVKQHSYTPAALDSTS